MFWEIVLKILIALGTLCWAYVLYNFLWEVPRQLKRIADKDSETNVMRLVVRNHGRHV